MGPFTEIENQTMEVVDLRFNAIQDLQPSMLFLNQESSIREVHLDRNRIHAGEKLLGLFPGNALSILSMSHNSLQCWDDNSLESVQNAEHLNWSHQNQRIIPVNCLKQLSKFRRLQTLVLSGNRCVSKF